MNTMKNIKNWVSNLMHVVKKEIMLHPVVYFLLVVILVGAFFVRSYRATDLMAFHYDQARDAIKIWDFWYKGDIFLVGPVTGLAGIFLGPLYYFMIAPIYLLGGGDPLYVALFLAVLGTAAIFVTYLIGFKIHSRETGVIASFIAGFSYYLMLAGRWVSNPTPIFLSSVILFYALLQISFRKSKNWWVVVALSVSASLQFESASAFFYLPIIFLFYFWQRRVDERTNTNLPDKRILLISFLLFFVSVVPQIIFSVAHQNMLVENFTKVFTEEKSFKLSFWDVIDKRLNYFWTVFSSKILPTKENSVVVFLLLSILGIFSWKAKTKSDILKLFFLFLGTPMVGYILFQGNHGNMYDYYMTGYYLPMIILFSLGLGILWKKSYFGKVVVAIFLIWFIQVNFVLGRYFLIAGVDGPTHISLGNELQSVKWVYDDAKALSEFNADFYVPPVIPHTYNYLFLWQGTKRCGAELCGLITDRQTDIVYVLYEVDPPHPERLANWLTKYRDTSKILKEVQFGGITVQKRERI